MNTVTFETEDGEIYEGYEVLVNWNDYPEEEPFYRTVLIADPDLIDEGLDSQIFYYYPNHDEFLADVKAGGTDEWHFVQQEDN